MLYGCASAWEINTRHACNPLSFLGFLSLNKARQLMQYLLNYSLTRQIQKYFSLTNPADVQATVCLLIFDLVRFICATSHHIHFYLVLLFTTYHHSKRWLMTKGRNPGISPSHPCHVSRAGPLSHICKTCATCSSWMSQPIRNPACFLSKGLLWSQKCRHKFSTGRKPYNSTEPSEPSPAWMLYHTKEWWDLQFRISLQRRKEKKKKNTHTPHNTLCH